MSFELFKIKWLAYQGIFSYECSTPTLVLKLPYAVIHACWLILNREFPIFLLTLRISLCFLKSILGGWCLYLHAK